LGIDADPIKSKEHILLSNILQDYWSNGEDLDLPKIIQSVQSPPFNKIGVFELESFYSEKERTSLAMSLNNILSAPGFQSWLTGEALDIDKLFYSKSGKPKISIFYTAHLSDSERMFFTSLLLNQLLSWMRMQSGTTSLRALLYVDEIFGYLPPVSNPPTKKPFLTLLKQARAFGLGLVLATQNPVDLDYKSLSNAGTWFLGRLQTERDRKRVLDGIEGASLEGGGKFNRKEIEELLSNLDKRVFLLHNVHEEHPQIFYSRWVMSYLRGPLTRMQIKSLVNPTKKQLDEPIPAIKTTEISISKTQLPSDLKPLFVNRNIDENFLSDFQYKPYISAIANIRFYDRTKKIDYEKEVCFFTPITEEVIPVNWGNAYEVIPNENIYNKQPQKNIGYANLPLSAANIKNYTKWEKFIKDHLVNNYTLELFYSPELKITSKPLESARDFKIRLSQHTREKRDEEVVKLKDKYSSRMQTIQSRINRAEERIDREKSQSSQQKLSTVISIGSTILGALFGKKAVSTSTVSKAGTAMKSAGKILKESGDVDRAQENLERLNQQMIELQDKLQDDIYNLENKFDLTIEALEIIHIKPQSTKLIVKLFNFCWVPLADETIENINELKII